MYYKKRGKSKDTLDIRFYIPAEIRCIIDYRIEITMYDHEDRKHFPLPLPPQKKKLNITFFFPNLSEASDCIIFILTDLLFYLKDIGGRHIKDLWLTKER